MLSKSGCYKTRLWEERDAPVSQLILWDENRMRMGDTFYNFWEHGRLTPGEALRREEENIDRAAHEAIDRIQKLKDSMQT